MDFVCASMAHCCKDREVEKLANSFAEGNFIVSTTEATVCQQLMGDFLVIDTGYQFEERARKR